MADDGNRCSRFGGVGLGREPRSLPSLDRLRRRRDLRVFPVCAVVAMLLLLGILYVLVPREREEAPKLLSTKFIKTFTSPVTKDFISIFPKLITEGFEYDLHFFWFCLPTHSK